VEVSPDVIALRNEFCIPNDDARFRVICANGADYVAGPGPSKDVILADACDREGVAPEIGTIQFYQNAHRRLFEGGTFVANVCGDPENSAAHGGKIRAVFGDEIMTLQVIPDGNLIVFAFKERRPQIDWEQLEATAADLARTFGLDFPKYLRRIAINWKLRRWQPAIV
jgi:spermidine synthase